ncbi:MAG TPA: translesion error-prone DNA polymerase V autoproteolytic subunit [Alphaproteobacteria bacterium]|nr:translesion error-prone DNA polymerase V autoproteolytic subunit [Alphaproteobacteria bacterium]
MEIMSCTVSDSLQLPLFGAKVSAGFPSPADDFVEKTLDLNEFLVKHPAATFFAKVDGESMTGAGIFPGDYLVVDRSLEAVHGAIVLAAVNGEVTVKRLHKTERGAELHAANPAYKPIRIPAGEELQVWGVVTSIIRKVV